MVLVHGSSERRLPAHGRRQRAAPRRRPVVNNAAPKSTIALCPAAQPPNLDANPLGPHPTRPRLPLFDPTPGVISSLLSAATVTAPKKTPAAKKSARASSAPSAAPSSRRRNKQRKANAAQAPLLVEIDVAAKWQLHSASLQEFLADQWQLEDRNTFLSIVEQSESPRRRASSAPGRLSYDGCASTTDTCFGGGWDTAAADGHPAVDGSWAHDSTAGAPGQFAAVDGPQAQNAATEISSTHVGMAQNFVMFCLPAAPTTPAAACDVGGTDSSSLADMLQWLMQNALHSNTRIQALEQRVAQLEGENALLRASVLQSANVVPQGARRTEVPGVGVSTDNSCTDDHVDRPLDTGGEKDGATTCEGVEPASTSPHVHVVSSAVETYECKEQPDASLPSSTAGDEIGKTDEQRLAILSDVGHDKWPAAASDHGDADREEESILESVQSTADAASGIIKDAPDGAKTVEDQLAPCLGIDTPACQQPTARKQRRKAAKKSATSEIGAPAVETLQCTSAVGSLFGSSQGTIASALSSTRSKFDGSRL